MKVGVILSAAKDLQFRSGEQMQILRFAQNDRLPRERSEASVQWLFVLRSLPRTAEILRCAQDDSGEFPSITQ